MKILVSANIRQGDAKISSELFLSNLSNSSNELFFKEIYRKLNLNYAKYFKMDMLSKLGFLTSELIFQKIKMNNIMLGNNTSIVLANSSSCLDTDRNFQNTITDKNNFHPSPAIFVYTLPNIVIGEICIKNKFTGENMFFCNDAFDPELIYDYVSSLYCRFNITNQDAIENFFCLTGWVEYFNNSYDSAMFLIGHEENSDKPDFNINNLDNLYRIN